MRNNRTSASIWWRWLIVALTVVLLFSLTACGGGMQNPLRALTENSKNTVSIETAHGTLAFPKDLYENLRHMEVTEGDVVMEVFYMVKGDVEKELFRLCFADAQVGTHLGYLTTEEGEIPVTYSVCEYAEEDFADQEEKILFYRMMDAFSMVVNSIYADPRFSETKAVAEVENREAGLRYWDVELPENVLYTETEENGNYRVDFYGAVGGKQIGLFTIALRDEGGESPLGLYAVDGTEKFVVVETCDMGEYAAWAEEEQIVVYKMMESLNTVVQTIVADKNFTEATPNQ